MCAVAVPPPSARSSSGLASCSFQRRPTQHGQNARVDLITNLERQLGAVLGSKVTRRISTFVG
jgi:hypothetical protein